MLAMATKAGVTKIQGSRSFGILFLSTAKRRPKLTTTSMTLTTMAND